MERNSMIPPHFFNGGIHGEQYGDGPWLVETVDKLPIRKQKPIAIRYGEIYMELVESDPRNCRYRANCWLRKIVEKYKPINDGLPF